MQVHRRIETAEQETVTSLHAYALEENKYAEAEAEVAELGRITRCADLQPGFLFR
jgi:hypothetical protein